MIQVQKHNLKLARQGRKPSLVWRKNPNFQIANVYECRKNLLRKEDMKTSKSKVFRFLYSKSHSLIKIKKSNEKRPIFDTKQPFDMDGFCEALKQKKKIDMEGLCELLKRKKQGVLPVESFQQPLPRLDFQRLLNARSKTDPAIDEARLKEIMSKYVRVPSTPPKPDVPRSGTTDQYKIQNTPFTPGKELPKPLLYTKPLYNWNCVSTPMNEFQAQYSRYKADEEKIAKDLYNEFPRIRTPCHKNSKTKSMPCDPTAFQYERVRMERLNIPCNKKPNTSHSIRPDYKLNLDLGNDSGKRYTFKTIDLENYTGDTSESNKNPSKTAYLPNTICRGKNNQNGFHYIYNPSGKINNVNIPYDVANRCTCKRIDEEDENRNTIEKENVDEFKQYTHGSEKPDENENNFRSNERVEYGRKLNMIHEQDHEENWENLLDEGNEVEENITKQNKKPCPVIIITADKNHQRRYLLDKYLEENVNNKQIQECSSGRKREDVYDSCNGDKTINTAMHYHPGPVSNERENDKCLTTVHNHRAEPKRVPNRTTSNDEVVTGIKNYDSGVIQEQSFQSDSTAESCDFAVIKVVEDSIETNSETNFYPDIQNTDINSCETEASDCRNNQNMTIRQTVNDTNTLTGESFVSAKSNVPPSGLKRCSDSLNERRRSCHQHFNLKDRVTFDSGEDEFFDCPLLLAEQKSREKPSCRNKWGNINIDKDGKNSKESILQNTEIELKLIDENTLGVIASRTHVMMKKDNETKLPAKGKSSNDTKRVVCEQSEGLSGRDKSNLRVSFKNSDTKMVTEIQSRKMSPVKKTRSVKEQKSGYKSRGTSAESVKDQIRENTKAPRTQCMDNVKIEVHKHEALTALELPNNQKLRGDSKGRVQISKRSPGRLIMKIHCDEYVPPRISRSIKVQTEVNSTHIDYLEKTNGTYNRSKTTQQEIPSSDHSSSYQIIFQAKNKTSKREAESCHTLCDKRNSEEDYLEKKNNSNKLKSKTMQQEIPSDETSNYKFIFQTKSNKSLPKRKERSHDRCHNKTDNNPKDINLDTTPYQCGRLNRTTPCVKTGKKSNVSKKRVEGYKNGNRNECQARKEECNHEKDKKEYHRRKEIRSEGHHKKEKRRDCNCGREKKKCLKSKEKTGQSCCSHDEWTDWSENRSLCTACADEEFIKELFHMKKLEREHSKPKHITRKKRSSSTCSGNGSNIRVTTKVYAQPSNMRIPVRKGRDYVFNLADSETNEEDSGHKEKIESDTESKHSSERSCGRHLEQSNSQYRSDMMRKFMERRVGVDTDSGCEDRKLHTENENNMFTVSCCSCSALDTDEFSDDNRTLLAESTGSQAQDTYCTTSLVIPRFPRKLMRPCSRYADSEFVETQIYKVDYADVPNPAHRTKSCKTEFGNYDTNYLQQAASKKWYHFCFKP